MRGLGSWQEPTRGVEQRAQPVWQVREPTCWAQELAVIQRVDLLAPRSVVKGLLQFGQLVWMLCRYVRAFREIGIQMVQGPIVHIDRRAAHLQRAGEPAVPVEASVGPELVMLFPAWRGCAIEQHCTAIQPVHGKSWLAVAGLQRGDASQ